RAGGSRPRAAYIFRKRLKEPAPTPTNRLDELAPEAVDQLAGLVASHYPGTPVLPLSAKTGQGFDALTHLLEQEGSFGRKVLDIDYDTYAEGEAELGWLNSSVHVSAAEPYALDDLLLDIISRLQDSLGSLGGEVAHLKVIG